MDKSCRISENANRGVSARLTGKVALHKKAVLTENKKTVYCGQI
jgi:hypothetical protein